MEEAPKKKKTLRAFYRLMIKLVIVASIILCLLYWVFSIHIVRGNNMYPAIRDGELVITYKMDEYNVGDVVVYRNPSGEKAVARVVAREGDKYDILEEYGPQINGSLVTEDIFYPTEAGGYPLPIVLQEGEVLLLNDFRSDKKDGRSFGPIKVKDTYGKVVFSFKVRGF